MIPALRRYARALTRDADIADDLVQDTLVRALRSEQLFLGGDFRSLALHHPDQSQQQPAAIAGPAADLLPLDDNGPRPAAPRPRAATSPARSPRWSTTSARCCCW